MFLKVLCVQEIKAVNSPPTTAKPINHIKDKHRKTVPYILAVGIGVLPHFLRNIYLDHLSILKLDYLVCRCFLVMYTIWISNHLSNIATSLGYFFFCFARAFKLAIIVFV